MSDADPVLDLARADDRARLSRQFDRLRRDLDAGDTMDRMDHYHRQALEIVLSGKAAESSHRKWIA